MIIIDIVFVSLFFIGSFGLWYRITQKIPELVAIPDQVIVERLHEDSAKVRLFILHIKAFYKETKYKEVFWKIAGKALYKLHIAFLRIDNAIVRALKRIKTAGIFNENGNGNGSGEYWKQLQEGLANFTVKDGHIRPVGGKLPQATTITPTAQQTLGGIHEVRKKRV